MGELVLIEDFDNFRFVKDFEPGTITGELIETVLKLDESTELEPYIRSILSDPGETPHGPVEIADILTHKVKVNSIKGLAAFIIKGKSFSKVRPADVSHQIYRLGKIEGLRYAVLAATGVILDAAKEEFCATACRIGCDYAIFEVVDLARLFVAYGFLCPRDGNKISTGRCLCGYSPRKRKLNILQDETLKATKEAHAIGQESGLVVLPPGGGKTRIAAEDAKQYGARCVLYVAHTHEILDVAQSEFQAVFSLNEVIKFNSREDIEHPNVVNISTIQLLDKNIDAINTNTYDYLVIDEFHHAAAKSYRRLIERVAAPFLLGLTATPFRGDRQNILGLCNENVLVNFELRSGIDMGILCPYYYFGCFDNIDYSNIRYKQFRYDIRDLEKALIVPERDNAIIEKWKEYAEHKATLAFCCSHRHANRVACSFNGEGIPAAVYLSNTIETERKKLIEALKTGTLKVLCVVDVLNEGADFPFIECLLFLRPTESKLIFYQQLGRGLRRYIGKPFCVVIDFIGNFKNAYRVVEYQGLLPTLEDEPSSSFKGIHTFKDILNLPLGCKVHFDARVIDVFTSQALDPKYATRHNIGRILNLSVSEIGASTGT